MEQSLTDRKAFYHILTRKITVLILVVSFFPLILTTGIIVFRFHMAYTDKIHAHISELVQKHSQNIDTFLSEKLENIQYLSKLFGSNQHVPEVFLEKHLALLKNEYEDVFTDLGLVNEKGIQFAYKGPFNLENADYSKAQWFMEAIDKPFYISDVFAGLRGHPHFIIAVKIKSHGSEYILRSTINFGAFNNLVENIQIGKTGIAFIINGKGQLQTQTNVGLHQSVLVTMVDRKGYNNNETVFTKREDALGNKYLCVASMLKNIDWVMVFRQDINDVFSHLWKTQLLAFIIFIFSCIAILSVAFLLPKNIVQLISKADTKSEAMNKQVVESGKLATIGELAAGIAHEINNPVAIMVEEAGWIGDLLEEEDLKECENLKEFNRALDQINTQGLRCKEITHKLLSFARKTDTTINDVQINEVITEMVSLTDKMAMYNNITIETDLHEGIPYIRISPSELQQVILNLINNAIDAMEKTGGKIRIETKISAIEKNHLVISMEDNGPGIPKDNLGRIFDPFFTTKAVGKALVWDFQYAMALFKKWKGK